MDTTHLTLHSSKRPQWLNENAPLQSAVDYLSQLSPQFHWVGVYVLKGQHLELGPYIGEKTDHTQIPIGRGICGRAVQEDQDLNIGDVSKEQNYLACSLSTRSELVVLIRDPNGQTVGQIDIDSHTLNAFGSTEEAQVREVAHALGRFWPSAKSGQDL